MDKRGVSSTSDKSQHDESKISKSSCSKTDSPIDKLFELEFCVHFYIDVLISLQLLERKASSTNGESSSTNELPDNMIYFTKEQFAGLRLPISFLFKQFLHFSKIPPAFIYPNVIWILKL